MSFEFGEGRNVSRYFIVCTVIIKDTLLIKELHDLRLALVGSGHRLLDYFHASEDNVPVREAVFNVICRHDISIQASIFDKHKAELNIRSDRFVFYKIACFSHFKACSALMYGNDKKTLMTFASVGTGKEKTIFQSAVRESIQKTGSNATVTTDFRPSHADHGLQIADYCAWAILRKWERGDDRWHKKLAPVIAFESEHWG